MDFIKGFWDNLGNKYTTVLLAFLNGFAVGLKFGRFSVLIGFLIGMIFAVFTSLLVGFFDTVIPQSITITINMRVLMTLTLIATLIFIVKSSMNFDNILAPMIKRVEGFRPKQAGGDCSSDPKSLSFSS